MVERYQVGISAQGHIVAAPSVNGKWVTYEACAKLVNALKEIHDELDGRYDGAPDSRTRWMGEYLTKAREALREIGELR